MKQIRPFLLIASFLTLAVACGKESAADESYPGLKAVSYEPTDEVIANPERGFYSGIEVHDASGSGIPMESMASHRKQGRSLYLLEFHMKDYVSTAIADDYLQVMRLKFESLRAGGAKCILRYCYSNGFSEKDKPWDATLEQALAHIAQVKPLIQEFSDVIMVVQAGFIGSWGEWYYTENYKDNASRKQIVDALLDAVPSDRQIQLRTPEYKMTLYGFGIADTLTCVTAHQNTIKARLGGHNDCYLASANDQGTFIYANDRAYWAAESPYVFMGGETCAVSDYCHCEPYKAITNSRGALADLAMHHYTYLNIGYNTSVLSRWRKEGCFKEIERRLGYRYVLDKGYFTKSPKAGEPFRVVLKLHNEGFAPAINPRDAELVLTDASGSVVKAWPLESDPRYWMPGKTVLDQTILLPDGISGEVQLHLNLPDPCATLHEDPRYSIRFANTNMWDETTGYNLLKSFNL